MHKKKRSWDRAPEFRNVESRVIWHRQLIQGEHAENGGKRSAKHSGFERHRDVCGPAVDRAATNIVSVRHDRHVVLERIAADAAKNSASQHDTRYGGSLHTDYLGESVHRHGRVSFDALVTGSD